VTVILAIVGLALIAVSIIYFTTASGQLPSFVPGRLAHNTHHHIKRAVLALVLGVLVLIGAWFSAGRKARSRS
jgi:multisubunit Na+/H+ antiporter MnhB subunit